jgi:hypothetical protein
MTSTAIPDSWVDLSLFIDKKSAEDYKCAICYSLVSNMSDLACGHAFCLECIKTDFKSRCPLCRAEIPVLPIPSKFANAIISRLELHCRNQNLGCPVILNVGVKEESKYGQYYSSTISAHALECKFEFQVCPDCKTTTRSLKEHRKVCIDRLVQCQYCGQEFSFSKIEQHCLGVNVDVKEEKGKCQSFAECPNAALGCRAIIQGDFMNLHLMLYCQKCKVECPWCSKMVSRDSLKQHQEEFNPDHWKAMYHGYLQISSGIRPKNPLLPLVMYKMSEVCKADVLPTKSICTASVTGKTYLSQEYWACETCWPNQPTLGCCIVCKDSCHKGHRLTSRHSEKFFCDCPFENKKFCKSLGDSSILTQCTDECRHSPSLQLGAYERDSYLKY